MSDEEYGIVSNSDLLYDGKKCSDHSVNLSGKKAKKTTRPRSENLNLDSRLRVRDSRATTRSRT